ncbi:protein of unknown function [Arenibacter nanhaiticus]|uniref:DUF4920 domain-containing protein n=1 Tax=Arenibacter nanhaiticus TaxID=558155 RepID=A0A1M6BIP0_9FLAO|nr:DUF4920 domain-containing protein [Arenibacter nanhaiticus]SHI48575.1 protein of unknown function [Arenibacter nanhaiticus]
MKFFNIMIVYLCLFVSCKDQKNSVEKVGTAFEQGKYDVFGAKISDVNALSPTIMLEKYRELEVLDTLALQFAATVVDVCQTKGCWMTLALDQGEEAMVKFKDYGFFMPKDIIGKEVLVNGKAFIEEMSVDDQRHFAKDAGKSNAEIASITEVKKNYGFEADGVLLIK